ncbi:MAG: hypothetical protein ACHQSE_02875 [Gemmatimonadales bacterium]
MRAREPLQTGAAAAKPRARRSAQVVALARHLATTGARVERPVDLPEELPAPARFTGR